MKSVEASAEQEAPRNDLDTVNHDSHSDFDNKFFDLNRLMNNGILHTSNLGMLLQDVSSDLSAVFCESSTISSPGLNIVPLSPESIQNAASQELSTLPPRRFYRTFWRAMARKLLTRAEMAAP